MKKYFILLVLSLILSVSVNATDVQRMDPPFWYAGMQNSELQIMFYGENLGTYSFNLNDYQGVKVKEICKLDNPNYLIVYLFKFIFYKFSILILNSFPFKYLKFSGQDLKLNFNL